MSDKDKNSGLFAETRTTTLSQGIFSLAKSAIGAGTLRLPICLAALGMVPGLGIMAFASIATTSTLHFLSRIAANTDLSSYFAIGKMAFGDAGQISAMVSLILFIFGALTFYISSAAGYVIDFLKFVRPTAAADVWYKNSTYMVIIIALALLPIASLRDMSALGKTSILGMVCMGYILGLTVIDYFVDSATASAATIDAFVSVDVAKFASVFSKLLFAFVNHFTMVSVVPSLINPTPERRAKVTLGSASFVLVFYVIVATFGFLHFGRATPDSVLEAPLSTSSTMNWMYAIGKLMMAIVLLLTYPLLLDPCRGTIEGALSMGFGHLSSWKSTASMRSFVITAVIVSVSAIIVITEVNVDLILNATVALTGSLMVFVFPSAYFLKLSGRYKVQTWERVTAYFNIAFGFTYMIFGTYFGSSALIASIFGPK